MLPEGEAVESPAMPGHQISGPPLAEVPFRTVPEMIAARAALDPERAALQARASSGKWQTLFWGALDARRRSLAAGLASLGVRRGDVVAVVSPNSPEMLIAELAAQTLGAAVAPIFPGYAPEILHHCLSDSGARVAFVAGAAQQLLLSRARQVQHIVVLDGQPIAGDERGLPLRALDEAGVHEGESGEPGEVAWLLYTSGTTGNPKGVELTHGNALSQQAAIAAVWDVGSDDVFLSYLPWHHCFGALFERLMALWHRALLVIDDSRGRDLDRLFRNLGEVRPTVYFGVPRVYNGMIARAEKDPEARAALRRLRFAFSAAAPLGEPAFRWLEENGIPVLEGWGLTETSPCVTITRKEDRRSAGVVGHPLPGTTVALDPVEGFSGRGEILVSGPQVMRGYRKRAEDSARVLRDGWLHSGDLGEWTSAGLKLFGRIDGVFKLANGEKVSSGEVEARMLAATPLLDQALVLGWGQPYVTALCWISPPAAQRWLEGRGLEVPQGPAALAQTPELRRALVEALQASNLLASVHFERVRRVALVTEIPSLETGELTPTMKLVRSLSLSRHSSLVDALRTDQPHPQILDIFRHGDPFGQP